MYVLQPTLQHRYILQQYDLSTDRRYWQVACCNTVLICKPSFFRYFIHFLDCLLRCHLYVIFHKDTTWEFYQFHHRWIVVKMILSVRIKDERRFITNFFVLVLLFVLCPLFFLFKLVVLINNCWFIHCCQCNVFFVFDFYTCVHGSLSQLSNQVKHTVFYI